MTGWTENSGGSDAWLHLGRLGCAIHGTMDLIQTQGLLGSDQRGRASCLAGGQGERSTAGSAELDSKGASQTMYLTPYHSFVHQRGQTKQVLRFHSSAQATEAGHKIVCRLAEVLPVPHERHGEAYLQWPTPHQRKLSWGHSRWRRARGANSQHLGNQRPGAALAQL